MESLLFLLSLLIYLTVYFFSPIAINLNKTLIAILSVGLLIFLSGGVQGHFILRLILWSKGYIPWNYAKFLDYATNRLLLQRLGGGYRFIHDLLRQHFASHYQTNKR